MDSIPKTGFDMFAWIQWSENLTIFKKNFTARDLVGKAKRKARSMNELFLQNPNLS
jgi:hypothetical protein